MPNLKPSLQGFRLVDDEYEAMEPDADGALISDELGLRLLHEGTYLRLINVVTGEPLLRAYELDAARRAAEDEVARLRAELARLRGDAS